MITFPTFFLGLWKRDDNAPAQMPRVFTKDGLMLTMTNDSSSVL